MTQIPEDGKDVWTKGLFCPRWEGLPLLFVAEVVGNLLLMCGVLTYAGILYGCYKNGWRRRSESEFPRGLVDLWILILLAGEVFAIYSGDTQAAFVVGIWALLDNAAAMAREFFALRMYGGYIIYTDRTGRRWLLITALNILQVILAFGLLFLAHAMSFNPEPRTAIEAIYYSAVTFITLGYGDYKPIDATGMKLVLLEIGFVIGFLLMKLPVAVSIVRTKPYDRG